MALLEGLEVSEVLLSQLEYSGRIDSEYYRPQFLKDEKLILDKGGVLLDKLTDFLIGPFGSAFTVDNYTDDSSYRYIRGKDVKPMRLMDDDNVYMPKSDYKRLCRYALKENDILVSVVGTVGNAAIVTKKDLPAIFSCKSTVLRPNDIIGAYLLVYINTKYGRDLLKRKERGAVQKGLNLDDLKTALIFQPSLFFQKQIESFFHRSIKKTVDSKTTYSRAEDLLLQSLNLKDFEPSQSPINIKSFSESFGKSGRLDAEYYQVSYEDYASLVTSYSNGFDLFENVCKLKGKNFNPVDKQEYKYIELSNIGRSGDITDCTTALGEELPTRARRRVSTGDVIVSSIEGSLDSCALVTKEYNGALCSTGFYVVNSNKINSETLLVLFKSKPMQSLLKRSCSGTILTAFSRTELDKIPIPLIDSETQEKIKKQVNEGFKLKKQSEHLLEVAKRAVEIAIEEDEEVALEYVKSETM